jgi:hypothetical protein
LDPEKLSLNEYNLKKIEAIMATGIIQLNQFSRFHVVNNQTLAFVLFIKN